MLGAGEEGCDSVGEVGGVLGWDGHGLLWWGLGERCEDEVRSGSWVGWFSRLIVEEALAGIRVWRWFRWFGMLEKVQGGSRGYVVL